VALLAPFVFSKFLINVVIASLPPFSGFLLIAPTFFRYICPPLLLLLAATPYLFVVVPRLCFLDWNFEVGLTSFFHNFIVDFRIEKVWYHGFFPISFYIKNFKIYFQKIEKLFDVYILKI